MTVQSYKDLIIWQKSIELVTLIYKLTDTFPKSELYGVVMQLRRCAVSIPSNIAEGWARKNTKEYINSLSMANGSAAELDTQLILSEKLGMGDQSLLSQCKLLLEEVQKMLPSVIRTLKGTSR